MSVQFTIPHGFETTNTIQGTFTMPRFTFAFAVLAVLTIATLPFQPVNADWPAFHWWQIPIRLGEFHTTAQVGPGRRD